MNGDQLPRLSLAPDLRVIEGYHGTTVSASTVAIAEQKLIPSHNPWDWLGDGIYFWEGSLNRAILWVRRKYGNQGAIVRARIRLGRCLDLFDTRWIPVIEAAHQKLLRESQAKGVVLPVNKGGNHALDRLVINYVCEKLYEMDSVRGPFLEGPPIFEGSLLPNLTHVQIAVRNLSMIQVPLRVQYPFGM